MFENNGHIHGQGQLTPVVIFFFKNVFLLLIWSFAATFFHLITLLQFFPIQTQRRTI